MAWFITETAQGHFENAVSNTVLKFGEAQAEKYLTELVSCFDALARGNLISRNIHQEKLAVNTGYNLHLCAHRYAVFKTSENGDITIHALFHKSMDIPHALARLNTEKSE